MSQLHLLDLCVVPVVTCKILGYYSCRKVRLDSSCTSGLGWAGLGWAGLGWAGLGWAGLGWAGRGWAGLGWAGLGWAGLGWAGLGWAGLGWAGLSTKHSYRCGSPPSTYDVSFSMCMSPSSLTEVVCRDLPGRNSSLLHRWFPLSSLRKHRIDINTVHPAPCMQSYSMPFTSDATEKSCKRASTVKNPWPAFHPVSTCSKMTH
jgi:hypothetical protein